VVKSPSLKDPKPEKRLAFAEGDPKTDTLREYFTPTRERYLTTQHERDTETGYDNRGARLYDADVMRFLSVDPLAADYAAWSSYNYVLGNPLIFVDPDGRSATNEYRPDGTFKSNLGGDKTHFYHQMGGSVQVHDVKSGSKVLITDTNFKFQIAKYEGRSVGEAAGWVELGALTATAVSGGTTAPVTGTVASLADGVSKAAVVQEFLSDRADGDGKIDLESKVHLAVELVSPIMSKQVSDHIVIPVIEGLSGSVQAVAKSTFDALQNLGEKAVESIGLKF
jgi:RHS repeat-associated protein